MKNGDAQQKSVLITGATDGLGRALALLLAERGYRVFAAGRSPEKLAQLESLAREKQFPLESIAIEGCRSGALTVGQAAELLGTSHNEVDGLLKNAGVYLDYTLEDLDADRETYRRLGM